MHEVMELLRSRSDLSVAAIVVGSLLVSLILDQVTSRVLPRLTSKTRTQLDDEIVAAVRRPLFVSVLLVGAWCTTWRLGAPPAWAGRIQAGLVTLGILLWTAAGMRVGKAVLTLVANRVGEHRYIQPRTVPLFDISVRTLIVGGAAYGILLAWDVDVTAWLASAGILGIAIGFAAKDTLANLFSGIFILADAPYKIGDYVVLASGERGRVTDIGIRSTRILTRDDIQIIIPNAAIAGATIVNETGGPHAKERIRVDVGVAYGSDIDQVRATLLAIAQETSLLCAEPAPRVRFRALGESSLDFQLLGWIEEPALRGRAIDELLTAIYKRFQAEGIVIPFPQRDVHLSRS
ncbi:MAG: mechanosensitive ion channel family protein [Polyangiaceae bacterium]|nr:mechanosensitive ion channel family protein [Polyangiaceae bacterium]